MEEATAQCGEMCFPAEFAPAPLWSGYVKSRNLAREIYPSVNDQGLDQVSSSMKNSQDPEDIRSIYQDHQCYQKDTNVCTVNTGHPDNTCTLLFVHSPASFVKWNHRSTNFFDDNEYWSSGQARRFSQILDTKTTGNRLEFLMGSVSRGPGSKPSKPGVRMERVSPRRWECFILPHPSAYVNHFSHDAPLARPPQLT